MNLIRKNYTLILLLIPVLSFVMRLHVLNRDLVGIHVWRQTQTQTVINNFYKQPTDILHPKYNDLNKQGERMEFPVMQWVFAQFHKVFGDGIAISRILSFIIGLFSVLGMFILADSVFKNKVAAIISAWAFNWSPVFYYYTFNPLPDNLALCCGIWSVAFFFKYLHHKLTAHLVFSAVFLSIATLAKLPFILYGALALGYILLQLKQRQLTAAEFGKIAIIFALALIAPAAWYITVIPTWKGNGVVAGVFDNTIGIGDTINIVIGHITSILPELLINYGSTLFFVTGFYFLFKQKKYRHPFFPLFIIWLLGILAYFLFEINMITLVHDYYLFPFLPIIFLIVAYGGWQLLTGHSKLLRYFSLLLLMILPLLAFVRIDSRWDTSQPGFNPVYYHSKTQLREVIPENSLCIAGNDESHFITLYYLDRKGWTFSNNWLEQEHMEQYIKDGAEYLVTDSDVDQRDYIQPYLHKKVFENGTLKVYKLKHAEAQ